MNDIEEIKIAKMDDYFSENKIAEYGMRVPGREGVPADLRG